MATVRILTLPTLEPEEAAAGHFVATDNAKDGNRKVDIGSFIHSVNETIDDIEAGTALADGAVITEKIADGAITNDKVATDAIETDNILDAAVTNAKLADNAVQTENLVTGAVTTDKLGADAVTNAKLADNAVQTENLVNESVTNAKLASDSVKTGNIVDENVTTSKLASGAVTTAKLDVDAVTNAKLADNAVQTENIVDANVTADKIANAAVTNDKLASNAVDSANIKSSAVITAKIADGAVTHDKVATNAIEAANIKDGEVGTSKLASGAVTNAKLASNAVETGNIKDAAVTTDKIANAAVTNSKLATDSVQTGNIKDGNVTNAKLASDAVGTSNIQNGSVTLAKIATGSEATQSASGLMSVTDKTKLDGFSQASDYALKTDISSAINYRGSVATESDLPSTGQKVGDMYNIVAASSYGAAGTNVAWTGSAWDSLGEKFTIGDGTLTPIMVASGYNFMTDAEQTKLGSIETGANKTVVDSALSGTSINPVQNSVVKDALDAKAPLNSPALTGSPTAPTAASGTNTTQVATTAFVKTAVDAKFPVVNANVAADAVDTTNIKNGAVTTDKLGANAVTHVKLASNSVEADNIKDGEVGTSKLASGAVTHDKIASDAVETANIKDANVTTTKLSAPIQKQLNQLNGVVDYIRYGVHQLESETWPYVAGLADLGEDALDLIPIGTELTDNWHDTHAATAVDYDFPWLVQSLEKFIFENQIEPMYGIVLGAKYTLPFGTQFDEKEAFYAVGPEGLVAGTYYFTWGFTWGSASVVTGNTYTLTTTNDYSEGAQFVFANQPQSSEIDGTNVNVYATCGGTTIAETCVLTKNNIEGATSLGTITTNQIVEGQLLNHGHRCCYGNGNWAESAIRQYLNTWADGGTWWTPQNKWDRPPSYANYDGFMKGLPPELRAVIQKTKVVTALSYSADAGTAAAPETVVTYDYFFLPSWEQHWLKVDSSYGAQEGLEGTPFPYWKKVSGVTTPWAAGTTHPEYIHYDLANHNTARNVFLRSAFRYNGGNVTYIHSSGSCAYNYALNGYFVVPVCVIRKAIA